MKRTNRTAAGVLFAISLGAAGAALAQSSDALPPAQTQGSVTFVTGGVGQDEAAAMKAAENSYPLALEFVKRAPPNGEFLANVDVTIKNRSGDTVLTTTSDGPFLLAKLPAGRYTVVAEVDGQTKTRSIVTGHAPKQVVVAW